MKKSLLYSCILSLLLSCHHKTFNDQLTVAFANHLRNFDPDVVLDSVHILWRTPVNQRLARIIDDTVYVREYYRIRMELASAQANNDKDSIAFCRYEIWVFERNIDSISKSISEADTTHQYGSLLSCAYSLHKNNKAITDSTLIYLDSSHVLRYTAYMDTSISRTARSINR
jgi:hypothetical protein